MSSGSARLLGRRGKAGSPGAARKGGATRTGTRHRYEEPIPAAVIATLATLLGVVLMLRYDPAPEDGAGTAAAASSGQAQAAVATAPGEVAGQVVITDFGHIQVAVTVKAGKVTAARALQTPEDGGKHGQKINDRALPLLGAEAVKAQSADIDTVSGATISSDGYRKSLQSALDAAHLA